MGLISRIASICGAALIAGAVFLGFKISSIPAPTPSKYGLCETISENIVKLSGTIDEAMQSCALELITDRTDTIIVNSIGGDVDAGRAIGYHIGAMPRRLVIEQYCLSSCGNYFVPAVQTVELKKGAVIGLHGSPDPHMLASDELEAHLASLTASGSQSASSAQRLLDKKAARRVRQLSEEVRFAERFSVPLGWRHYREAGDAEDSWRKHFTKGSDKGVTPDRFMIVEGPMMRSCLPHVETKGLQDRLERTAFKEPQWQTLKKDIGAYRSFGLTCKALPLD